MVLQLEDCVGVIMHLYPEYDYLFLYDHSSGHDKQREDGLNVKNDKKLWWNTMKNERYSYKTRKRLSYKKEAFLQERGLLTRKRLSWALPSKA
jgi:hypothetical protein